MKELVRHLLANNLDRIISRSLLNCHATGLHSIMLLESPEQTIRLYITEENHTLWKNIPHLMTTGLSLGFHPHHCNLTLHVIRGTIFNWVAETIYETKLRDTSTLDEYIYQSAISTGKQGFSLNRESLSLALCPITTVEAGNSISMEASTLHTVGINKGEVAAWLVYEGKEDPDYQPLCYSNVDLTSVSTEGLYQKPTAEDVLRLIDLAGLYDD